MIGVDDSDDDSCVPKSRAAVKLDLSKHLPPRLSFSQSDEEARRDSNKPASNAFEAFSFRRSSSGGSGNGDNNGIARPALGQLQTGLGAAPACNAKQQSRQPTQPPAQPSGWQSKQQSHLQPAQHWQPGSEPKGSVMDSLTAADAVAQPDTLEDASPSPLLGNKRGFAAASGQQLDAQPQATKRRALVDDSDEEAAAPAEPRSRGPLVSESPVPETPHPAAIDLTADDTPAPAAPAAAAAAPSVPEPVKPPPAAPLPKLEMPHPATPPTAIELSDDEEAASPGQVEPEGVLEQCERIAQRIRAALGDQLSAVGSQAEVQGDLSVVDLELLAAACGGLSASLKPYQMVGVNWLLLLARLGVGGCILADEMGLGKTAQAICFLGVLKAVEQDPGPHLVVAPVSLLENWQRELARWAPALNVSLYHGSTRMDVRDDWKAWEQQQADGAASSAEAEPPPFDVLLTTYTMFERDGADQKEDRKFLRRVASSSSPWSHMVLDEAHAIKSKAAARTLRLRAVATVTKRRLFLTGTPLQNDLTELKTLLSFLEPEVFGAAGERLDELEEDIPEEQLVASMRGLLDTFMLRRLKEQVASQLVAKQQEERRVAMTATQAALYDAAVQQFRSEAASRADAKSGKAAAAARNGGPAVLPALGAKKVGNIFVHLRKVAQHPLLVRSAYTDGTVQEIAAIAHKRGDFGSTATLAQVQAEVAGYSDHELHAFCRASRNKRLQELVLPAEKMRESAKFGLLAELLPALRGGGHRALLFSQWTSILDLIEWLMQDLGLKYVRLDGSTAVADRLTIVDSFNQDSSIFAFLLSTRAGGQGLNLVGADTVLIHDSDWNPQTDRQAEDRSHRLGQERPVTIYRLITEGTVDADIVNIAQRKLRLDAAVLNRSGGGDAADEKAHMSTILAKILEGDKTSSQSE